MLSQVSPDWFNIPSLYCANNDPDCMGVYSAGSWSDAQGNYFAAGTRSDMSKKEIKTEDNTYYLPTTLYAINDKLYLP